MLASAVLLALDLREGAAEEGRDVVAWKILILPAEKARGGIGAFDGARHAFDVFLASLVVEVLDPPFLWERVSARFDVGVRINVRIHGCTWNEVLFKLLGEFHDVKGTIMTGRAWLVAL